MKQYTPSPKNTDHIDLPEELTPLIDAIAKNVHEVWAHSRISEGWEYGDERNDEHKLHPCLVPYEKLSETEKAYDRNTAIGTIKLIQSLGFNITISQEKNLED